MNIKSCFSILILTVLAAVLPNRLSCQFVIDWAKTYGASVGQSNAYKVRQTSDGGYIVAGYSNSGDGDLTGNHGDWDYWIMKLDSRGEIEWSKNYGGSGVDSANDVLETEDGGFLVIGHSNSTDGDVSENIGGYDCWILQLNGQGELVWQKSYGGSQNDVCRYIAETKAAFFGMIGFSESNDIDLSFNNGLQDIWLLEINSSGVIERSLTFGNKESDQAGGILPLYGDKYIISGKKDDSGWIAMVNGSGDVIWSRVIGGTYFVRTPLMVFDSVVTGVAQANDEDVLVFQIDTKGQILNGGGTYGGSKTDSGTGIQPLPNGDYLVAGISASSDGDVNSNYGNFDWWLFVIDKAGKLKWEKNYGGSWGDLLYSMEPAADGGFILAGQTTSKDYDVVPRYDGELAWIVKLRPENTTGACGKPNVYPNPASNGVVKIEVKEGFGKNGSLEIFDVTGRTVLVLSSSELADKSIVEISVADLPGAGVYFIRTNCGEETHVVKFVRL